MSELNNVFAKGTQALNFRETLFYKPINEDYSFVGKVKSVSPGIIVNKAWDADATKDFSVSVAHQDGSGVSSGEIEQNQYLPVFRKPDEQFSSILQNAYSFSGIGAYVYSAGGEYSKESFVGTIYCGLFGKTWKKTNLKIISSYKVMKYSQSAISVVSSQETEIFIDDLAEIIFSRIAISSCSGPEVEVGKVYPVSLLPGVWRNEGIETNVLCIIGQSTLAAGYLCCEEEEPPVLCHDATCQTGLGNFLLTVHATSTPPNGAHQDDSPLRPNLARWPWSIWPHMRWVPNVFEYYHPKFYDMSIPDGMPSGEVTYIYLFHAIRSKMSSWWSGTTDEEYNAAFDYWWPAGEGNKIIVQIPYLVPIPYWYAWHYVTLTYQQTSQPETEESKKWNGIYTFEKAYSSRLWKYAYDEAEEYPPDYIETIQIEEAKTAIGSTITISDAKCSHTVSSYTFY